MATENDNAEPEGQIDVLCGRCGKVKVGMYHGPKIVSGPPILALTDEGKPAMVCPDCTEPYFAELAAEQASIEAEKEAKMQVILNKIGLTAEEFAALTRTLNGV